MNAKWFYMESVPQLKGKDQGGGINFCSKKSHGNMKSTYSYFLILVVSSKVLAIWDLNSLCILLKARLGLAPFSLKQNDIHTMIPGYLYTPSVSVSNDTTLISVPDSAPILFRYKWYHIYPYNGSKCKQLTKMWWLGRVSPLFYSVLCQNKMTQESRESTRGVFQPSLQPLFCN